MVPDIVALIEDIEDVLDLFGDTGSVDVYRIQDILNLYKTHYKEFGG